MVGDNEVRWRNRALIYFSGCDYFRLSRHPAVASAAGNTLKKNGLNVAASRLTTGNHKIYAQLEKELAAFFGAEAALVFPDGYLAPLAVAQALAGEFSHAFIDELAHAALIDAARMLHCPVKTFAHRNAPDLSHRLAKLDGRSRTIVLTDGMFSHDGSVAPLREYLANLPRSGMILVDDAHGTGVLGAKGRGALEYSRVSRNRIIQCATMSKAVGAYGGVVLGTRKLREKIITRSRLFAGSTPLPLPLAGAALAGLAILKSEPARRKKLFCNVAYLRGQLRQLGWEIAETPGPIVRLPFMNAAAADNLKKRLLAAGIYPPFVKYGKASAAGFFRFVISSEHTQGQLDRFAVALGAFKSKSR
jgi:8-amino-7-oxononanoate synthase